MNIVVFEDLAVRDLSPITLSKPAYQITCASYRLVDWLIGFEPNLVGVVRPYLQAIQSLNYPAFQPNINRDLKWTLIVNARLAPTVTNIHQLQTMMVTPLKQRHLEQPSMVVDGEQIAAAVVPTSALENVHEVNWDQLATSISKLENVEVFRDKLRLFHFPHDVIDENLKAFGANLDHRVQTGIADGRYTESQPGVFLGKGVAMSEQVAFDSSTGPVVIDDGVIVGPFSFFRGPVYVGRNSKISEHASIKDGVSVNHTCKIGGEVEGTILEPYTNKQHHGFLGHSYLGSWINLGAGTCNSDLKNTYGTVNMIYGGRKVSTGLQFIGCILGDYAKTAINTSIFTGKTIGVASMIYGFATTNVPSFVNYARTFNEYGLLPPEVVVTTQKRMFHRRNVEQRPCDIQLLHDMFRITSSSRADGLSEKPLSL